VSAPPAKPTSRPLSRSSSWHWSGPGCIPARPMRRPRTGASPTTTDITMTLDTPDALLFDQTVTRIAGDLRELGDTEDLEVRRARAVGILTDPSTRWTCSAGVILQHPAAEAVPRTFTSTSPPQTWPLT
jgi:hypothetical protein